MLIKLFKSKIHRATITESDLHYEGSCSIDSDLMEAAGILQNEAIWVWNINTGSRLMTYALKAQKGSGIVCLNGSAARLGHRGDLIIITTFADMTEKEAKKFEPTVVLVNESNKIKQIVTKSGHTAEEIDSLSVMVYSDPMT
jgi:aspartate 1-decarboxylase